MAVQAVAESYGAADLTASAPAGEVTIPGMTGQDSVEARLFGGTPAERPELAAYASPLTHVRAGAPPPFQISPGTADPLIPWTHSHQLHAALTAAGATSDLYLLDGYRHGFLNSPRLAAVDADQLLDGGRIAAEGPARAHQHSSTPLDEGSAEAFDFNTVARFFGTHLQR